MPPRGVSTESNRLKRKRQTSAPDNAANGTGVQSMVSVTVPERLLRSENERNEAAGAFEDTHIDKSSAAAKNLVDLEGDENSSEEEDFVDDLDSFSTADLKHLVDLGGDEDSSEEEDFMDDLDSFSTEDPTHLVDLGGHKDSGEEEDYVNDLDWFPTQNYGIVGEGEWLKPVRSSATAADGVQIRSCTGDIVYRDSIRKGFYSVMEEQSHELAELAFSLFDRWGNVKSDYISHPVKKGTGVWGKELNRGCFLYIENVRVAEGYRGQGFGRRMVEDVFKQARELDPSCRFALTWPVFMDDRSWIGRIADAGGSADLARMTDGQMATEKFWRSLGFRAIGTSPFLAAALTGTHPSLTLSRSDDWVRPFALRGGVFDSKATYPYNMELLRASDDATLRILQQRAEAIPPNDARWFTTDLHGRNLMHCVAASAKPKALTYLQTLPCASHLSSARDLEGDTPLEHLERRLDKNRTLENLHGDMIVVISDEFKGHSAKDVASLAQLTGTSTTDSLEMDRLRFGCTCGECIAGFISPRTAFALIFQGGLRGDELADDDWEEWCHVDNYLLCYLPFNVQWKMTRSEAMCNGFAAVFFHFIEVLRAKRAPTTVNILQQAAGERPAFTKTYIDQGGSIAGPILGCFERAMAEDTYLGDRNHELTFRAEIRGLKECRNDHEFEFVRRQFLRMEGLPVGYPN